MGPVKGQKKKRKVEKKVAKDDLASGSSQNGSAADWFEILSKRIAGKNFNLCKLSFSCFACFSFMLCAEKKLSFLCIEYLFLPLDHLPIVNFDLWIIKFVFLLMLHASVLLMYRDIRTKDP